MGEYDLLDVIFLAKKIIRENKNMIASKESDREYLGDVKYNIHKSVQLHTCVRPLIQIVKKTLIELTGLDKIDIKILMVNTAKTFKGESRIAGIMLKESTDKYVILLNESETYCTQRFTLCKELCQILIDAVDDDQNKTGAHDQVIEATRELVVAFYSSDTTVPDVTKKYTSLETVAHALALELMIPFPLRSELSQLIEKKVDTLEIAKRLFITKETLDKYLKTYYETTTQIYSLLDIDDNA